ncbi:MAG: hypothetical protein ABI625_08770 [bacterium]
MNEVIIRPVGGVVGAGSPGGHVQNEGRVAWSALPEADRARLTTLFANPKVVSANFKYVIVGVGPTGQTTTDALPDEVPAVLVAAIRSVLR